MSKFQQQHMAKDASGHIHISSLVVQVLPRNMPATIEAINAFPEADVHMNSPEGKIVVTMETENRHQVTDRVAQINEMPGVINAILVYHQIEDADTLDDIVDVDLPPASLSDIMETPS